MINISDIFEKLICREIISAHGLPTIELELHTIIGIFRSSAPIAHSFDHKKKLAPEERNKVDHALFNIKHILAKKIENLNLDVRDQNQIDDYLCSVDGTEDLCRIGVNCILPLSVTICKAGAVASNLSLREHISNLSKSKMKLPVPIFTMISKKEGYFKEKSLFEELFGKTPINFHSVAISFPRKRFSLSLKEGFDFFLDLKKVLYSKFEKQFINSSDDGSFYAPIDDARVALSILQETAENHFYKDYFFVLKSDNYLAELDKFNIKFVETNDKIKVPTLSDRIQSDYLMIKLDSVGTVSAAVDFATLGKNLKKKIVVGASKSETEETYISDFAVGIGADYFFIGAPCRGERVNKFNQILRIEESLKNKD